MPACTAEISIDIGVGMVHIIWGFIIFIVALFVTFFIAVIPALILRLVGLRKASDAIVYYFAGLLANMILLLCGVKVKISGDIGPIQKRIREGEGFCFISNHTSILDIAILFGKLHAPVGFVAKKELSYIPVINLIIWLAHSVFIDRKNFKRSVASVRKATDNIRKGQSMVIFPEGTRSKTGEIAPFKHGSFRMATESGVDIVPLTIKGLRIGFEDRKHAFQRSVCYLNIGKPITPPKPEDREAVSLMIAQVESGIREAYNSLG